MKVLITGVAGFIGFSVAQRILRMGFSVLGIDNLDPYYSTSTKQSRIQSLFKFKSFQFLPISIFDISNSIPSHFRPDLIIHLAALPGIAHSLAHPGSCLQTNTVGTVSVLEFARVRKVSKILFSSSSSVYGNSNLPFSESDSTIIPLSPYAVSKKSAEMLMSNYHHLYGINILIFRLFSVYGPESRPDLVIQKFFNQIHTGKPCLIYGDGNLERDFTFIDDVIDGLMKGIHYLESNSSQRILEIFNIGSGKSVPINKILEILKSGLKRNFEVRYLEKREEDARITLADISKAYKFLEYSPKVEIEEGISRLIDYHKYIEL